MLKNAWLSKLLLLIVIQTFSLPSWSHVINWQLSEDITKNSQNYDTKVKWLEVFPLYLPATNESGLVETRVSGLTQFQVLDHPYSQSISNLSQVFIKALIQDGFELLFQCTDGECEQASTWNQSLKDYLFDMSDSQAYLVGYRDASIQYAPTDPNSKKGEYIHIYLNEIGCCVRSIWRYTDLNQTIGAPVHPKVLFASNSDQLSVLAKSKLELIFKKLNSNNKTYLITGHTDSLGTEAYNLSLSSKRAAAVIDYLISMGIPASRLVQKSLGSSQPLVMNDSNNNRKLNRRVEIMDNSQVPVDNSNR